MRNITAEAQKDVTSHNHNNNNSSNNKTTLTRSRFYLDLVDTSVREYIGTQARRGVCGPNNDMYQRNHKIQQQQSKTKGCPWMGLMKPPKGSPTDTRVCPPTSQHGVEHRPPPPKKEKIAEQRSESTKTAAQQRERDKTNKSSGSTQAEHNPKEHGTTRSGGTPGHKSRTSLGGA